jgi:ferredoxin, 2Fe-2S
MPRVRFTPGGAEVEVPPGFTILEAAQRCGAPVGSACGGNCGCSTCHVVVKVGAASLSAMEDDESDALDKAFGVKPASRLGCRARLGAADVEVEISRESLNAYADEHPGAPRVG